MDKPRNPFNPGFILSLLADAEKLQLKQMTKNGFWNYTEPVTYRVVLVKLAAVEKPPLSWQNAFAGQTRQAVEITYKGQPHFYIDNGDGQGLLKAENRGGPEYGSRHLHDGAFEIVAEVDEAQWQKYDNVKYWETEFSVQAWQKTNHPEEFQKLQDLKEAWAQSKHNPKNKK